MKLTLRGRLVGAVLAALIVAFATYAVIGIMQGDPYENRKEGAAGICPIVGWGGDASGEGPTWAEYGCENETQRQMAADVVRQNYAKQRTFYALFSGAAMTAGGVLWVWEALPVRCHCRRRVYDDAVTEVHESRAMREA